MASASTVAVVVPSPATSLVLEATSRTMRAPMFSYLSSSSISRATVTPSLVTVGEPNDFWMMTFRPLGPRVTLTARASLATPRRMASRASMSKAICLADISKPRWWCCSLGRVGRVFEPTVLRLPLPVGLAKPRPTLQTLGRKRLVDNGEDVFLAHDQQVVAGRVLLLDLVPGPAGEQDGVAHLDLHRGPAAVLLDLARPDGRHLALLGLLLGRVRQEDAAGRLLFGGQALDQNAVVEGLQVHRRSAPPTGNRVKVWGRYASAVPRSGRGA